MTIADCLLRPAHFVQVVSFTPASNYQCNMAPFRVQVEMHNAHARAAHMRAHTHSLTHAHTHAHAHARTHTHAHTAHTDTHAEQEGPTDRQAG